MHRLARYVRLELCQNLQPAGQVLLVFLGLHTIFALLLSPYPLWWKTFQPPLLMGLAYVILGMGLTHLFQDDFADGTMELQISRGKALEKYVAVKITTHWLHYGLSLTILSGILTGFGSWPLITGIGLATLALTLTGAISSALCLDTGLNTLILLPLLTLPLGIPVLIVNMACMSGTALNPMTGIILQVGLFLMACGLSLVACPYALRLSLR